MNIHVLIQTNEYIFIYIRSMRIAVKKITKNKRKTQDKILYNGFVGVDVRKKEEKKNRRKRGFKAVVHVV